ncbi:MAG: DsrE/DsrF/DrsH-like family protein [Bacteroidota bacterium]|nr:DsrE/DsrF/DrsH-like family protein [Bacteroidota bacterium]
MSLEIEKHVQELQQKLNQLQNRQAKDQISIIAFSGDLDKMLAAMIIATGARAMDTEVKMFFTFWATAMLRDPQKSGKGKDFMSKMFGFMMPRGSKKLKLSKMNMCGMGTSMLKGLMKKKRVASLEELIATAGELGVEINVCEMSMDLMGFKREEMIDYPHLNYVGVGSYLADADESRIQLFI